MASNQILQPAALEEFMQEKGIPGEILYLQMPTPTVEAAAVAVGTNPENIIKSILFTINQEPVLAITCGPSYIERRAIALHFNVGRKKVKLADPDTVISETGYQIGGMPPFGHLTPLQTLIDQRVLEKDQVYAGGGSDQTLLQVKPQIILSVTQAHVMDLINRPTPNVEQQVG
jgi:prolyl-tRNA editing enzyme YbaK/EbsC (Cys-tRNA(Pro) deacylase)